MSGACSGLRVLITGGASGIGLATARMLLSRGAAVAVIDREAVAVPGIASAVADLTDPPGLEAAVAAMAAALGGIDILVNSAGIDLETPFSEMGDAEWNHVLDINLNGPMRACRAAFPYLRASDRASVVNVSSAAGLSPIPDRAAYCASKAGVVMLSKSLALDWAAHGIRVNTVCPGAVQTPLFEQSYRDHADSEARLDQIRARYPLGRVAEPDELAEAIVFLASPAASYITGTTLAVDAGRSFH
ncbi:SDR family NAD(P)-dependent oxidoreductase [Acidimangrovimonas sediminis]|uniref:SDR family NAD(P)-dependent oxidoreductase n=1 Tax=Acidimangrovimonas sediminis TaxID=2056283 RepID=UPI000C80596D|nr:SDR family oxidoreductase [Acidimangrovimonas sediminis]